MQGPFQPFRARMAMHPVVERYLNKPWKFAALGAFLLWGAFPPLGWFWLAPLAILPLLGLVTLPAPLTRRDYVQIWLAGCGLWLALLQGIRLAYWPLYLGWIALACYVAVYLPLFVYLARLAYHRYKVPLVGGVVVSWIGLELFRGYFATGFSTCLLAHTQAKVPLVLQIASQLGSYGVSAWVLATALAIYHLIDPAPMRKDRWISLGMALAYSIFGLGYGYFELRRTPDNLAENAMLRVGLVQENTPSQFEMAPNPERNEQHWFAYLYQTEAAYRKFGEVDIWVWPESVFTRNEPTLSLETDTEVPPEWSGIFPSIEQLQRAERVFNLENRNKAAKVFSVTGHTEESKGTKCLLVGSDFVRCTADRVIRHNAMICFDSSSQVQAVYSKRHRVMFGEYLPLADWFPFINSMVGIAPLSAGDRAIAFEHKGLLIAPSICFENTLPHYMRRQFTEIASQTRAPDLMVNVTNDSWFRGSSILDHHLASGILASVENRRPLLIAGNTGLSAWIDGSGRVVEVTPRLTAASILATPVRDTRSGLWTVIGDLPARLCTLACGALLIATWIQHRTNKASHDKKHP